MTSVMILLRQSGAMALLYCRTSFSIFSSRAIANLAEIVQREQVCLT